QQVKPNSVTLGVSPASCRTDSLQRKHVRKHREHSLNRRFSTRGRGSNKVTCGSCRGVPVRLEMKAATLKQKQSFCCSLIGICGSMLPNRYEMALIGGRSSDRTRFILRFFMMQKQYFIRRSVLKTI